MNWCETFGESLAVSTVLKTHHPFNLVILHTGLYLMGIIINEYTDMHLRTFTTSLFIIEKKMERTINIHQRRID